MKKIIVLGGICLCLTVIACLQLSNDLNSIDPRGRSYAGAKACVKCHSNIYNSYLHTAHFLSSLPASKNSVHGNFTEGFNVFSVNDTEKLVMEKKDSDLLQTYYLKNQPKDSFHFDIVFGGVKGESYLYWSKNELYQLPLSYYSKQRQWSTSPGYDFNFLSYARSRSIAKQCLECHVSYINDLPEASQKFNKAEQFDKSSLIYGIDCERCHGPAADHVTFHTRNPDVKIANFITSYKSLNRIQQIDMCAVCHSGKPTVKIRSSFEFIPGDTFANFKMREFYSSDTSHLDVHGNQVQLLQSSKCYINSKMNCTTCHDPHQNSRDDLNFFTNKCLNCHNVSNNLSCIMKNKLSKKELIANCINCHMPALPSKFISVQVSNKMPSINFLVHTHHIATYSQEVKKVLSNIDK